MLPSRKILELRNEILQVFLRHGLLETGSSVDKGIYNEILGLRKFNAFFHHQLVTDIIEKILGDSSFVHPRVICHILFPGNAQDTVEPHQDFAPVRGTPNAWTVWTPLGNCSDKLGGITVATWLT